MTESDAERLAQLEAFGKDFLSAFAPIDAPEPEPVSRATKKMEKKRKRQQDLVDNSSVAAAESVEPMDALFGVPSTSQTAGVPKPKAKKQATVQTVVFANDGGKRPSAAEDKAAKKGWKSFMSSKIDKMAKEDEQAIAETAAGGDEEEKELKANDRLLSDLLSTTLFAPGSGNGKGKAKLSSSDTLARILELSSGDAERKGQALGRGWGEKEVKRQQLAKAPAAIRQGMRKAAGERRDKERDKAKELGTWHPSLKQAYSSQATATEMGNKKEPNKRNRGMGVGIGKFQGGILTLSKHDIRAVNGPSKSKSKAKNMPRSKPLPVRK